MPNTTTESSTWRTSELGHAAWLNYNEVSILDYEWIGSICYVVFHDTPLVRALMEIYNSGKAQCEPGGFLTVHNRIKHRILNHSSRPRQIQ